MNKLAAIHQPNFFPWLGFFNKIQRADQFILLDNVQFPKKGGSWINRVQLILSGNPKWVTATIDRNFSGTKKINEIQINNRDKWKLKFLKTLHQNFSKHPYFLECMGVLEPLIIHDEKYLSHYNIHALRQLLIALKMDTRKLVIASELESITGKSNELLVNLTKKVGCQQYMCGGGAGGYQDEQYFKANQIELIHQNFFHPIYPQHKGKDFVSGLSIIDCLMNLGFNHTSELIKGV